MAERAPIDFFRGQPYPEWDEARRSECPVIANEGSPHDPRTSFQITRYADAEHVLRDGETFSSTKLSGQTALSSASFSSKRPGCSTSASSISKNRYRLAMAPQKAFLGIQPPLALEVLGAVLALYGAFLFYSAAQAQLKRPIVIAAIALDLIWVIDSAILLVAGWLPLTSAGMWTIGLIAAAVVVVAELKFFGLRRTR